MVGALAHSCNVYFYETGIDAGIESIADTAKLFGFGESTGIELKEESWRRTIVATPEFKRKRRKYDGPWTNGDTANASIGQGYMLFTPLQVASFAASFARGETRTKLSMLHDSRRKTDAAYHGAEKIPLTKSQYDKILEGMVAATERGTSKRARVAGVKVAAKSGTAQVSVNGTPADARVADCIRPRGVSRSRDGGNRRGRRAWGRGRRQNGGSNRGGCVQKVFFGRKRRGCGSGKLGGAGFGTFSGGGRVFFVDARFFKSIIETLI